MTQSSAPGDEWIASVAKGGQLDSLADAGNRGCPAVAAEASTVEQTQFVRLRFLGSDGG